MQAFAGAAIALLLLTTVAASGCTNGADVYLQCHDDFTIDSMNAKWQPPGEYNRVGLAVHGWGFARHEVEDQGPPTAIDWASYPSAARPEIIDDLLCWTFDKTEAAGGENKRQAITGTSKTLAEATMARLVEEHERQTGVWKPWNGSDTTSWEERCCYIEFKDRFWGATCYGISATYVDRHNHTTCGGD